jgi:chromosome segregation protein
VDSPDHVPVPAPAGCTFVTRNGSALRADGGAAFGADGSSPSAARQTREELQKEIAALSARIAEGEASAGKARSERDDLRSRLAQAQSEREKRMHESAVLEGQASVMARECRQSRERLNTVAWELQNLAVETEQGTERKASLDAEIGQIAALREQRSREIQERNTRLRDAENELAAAQSEWTEQSVRFAQVRQEADHLESRHGAAKSRIEELDGIILARADSVRASESSIGDLREAIRQAESDLAEQQRHAAAMVAEADVLRGKREKQTEEMETLVQTLSRDRETLDELRSRRSEIEVKHSESLMRRQSQLDRIASDYNLTAEQLAGEPEPAWGAEKPATEAIETAIAELRTKLEAMGPVNLVAIEEHRQLEERCAFLSQQEQDLVNAKQQLLEMIRKINRTTSEMFRSTFAAINENFVNTFRKLFNGGSARLVLVNEEDVLECGIEIIARPPGKRLQNISLLSGGERTLTAVSLLFAIYMTKPSPFCMLDEMDAPLDDSNIGRFLRMVQDFLIQSQFVVITHNRQTISAAGTIYGVTMPEKGISKIVSMKFNRQQAEPAPAAPPSAPAPVPA